MVGSMLYEKADNTTEDTIVMTKKSYKSILISPLSLFLIIFILPLSLSNCSCLQAAITSFLLACQRLVTSSFFLLSINFKSQWLHEMPKHKPQLIQIILLALFPSRTSRSSIFTVRKLRTSGLLRPGNMHSRLNACRKNPKHALPPPLPQ